MLPIRHDDVLIEKVPVASSSGVPPELSDVNRVAEDILNGAVLEGIAPVGAYALVVQLLVDIPKPRPCRKLFKNAADMGSFFWQGN